MSNKVKYNPLIFEMPNRGETIGEGGEPMQSKKWHGKEHRNPQC